MSYPGIHEPKTPEQAITFLRDAMDYVAARYGGTLAHHILAIAHRRVKLERFRESYAWDRSLTEHMDKQILALNPAYRIRDVEEVRVGPGHVVNVITKRVPAESSIV